MKRELSYLCFGILIAILLISLISALSQKKLMQDCNKNCIFPREAEIKNCSEDYTECISQYHTEKKLCLDILKKQHEECRNNCSSSGRIEKGKCLNNCSKEKTSEKEKCNQFWQEKDCAKNMKDCKEESRINYLNCSNDCSRRIILSKEQCNDSGGFFYNLCNGPYFDIVCSKEKFCICGGNNNYNCPENYYCEQDIKSFLPRRDNTIGGYKDMLGKNLGDIGICQELQNRLT
jgi:hypothetical protein